MVIRKEDTPQRLANRRYEEKNKQMLMCGKVTQ